MDNLFSKDFKKVALKSIHQVSEEIKIEPYILRFWETKFSQISPTKGKGNRRLYNDNDIALIKRIKHLLYDKGFTIEGAKKHLSNDNNPSEQQDNLQHQILIDQIIAELQEVKEELDCL